MKVKRFFAKTMQEALRSVRDEMGADAVILSNRKVDGGVEIVTAINYDEALVKARWQKEDETAPRLNSGQLATKQAEHQIRLEEEMQRARTRIESIRRPQKSQASTDSVTETIQSSRVKIQSGQSELDIMKAEILQLREMLKGQASSKHEYAEGETGHQGRLPLVLQQLQDQLEELGVEKGLIKRILSVVDQDKDIKQAWSQALDALSKTLASEDQEMIHRGGIYALVGSTGAGKTTTIGKMAARYVLTYGSDSIALVTTDRYRVAAHEQLKVFGRILNIPVTVVDEKNSLNMILEVLSDKKLILIDTAGLSYQDPCWSEQMLELQQAKAKIKRYLVLPATTQMQIMTANYHHYKKIGINGCFLTKLDEALTLGEGVSFLAKTGLALAYITDGQKIPDDIHPVTAAELIKRAVSTLDTEIDYRLEREPSSLKSKQAGSYIDIAG
jgi:flagellar biosynthesis protein FlhF